MLRCVSPVLNSLSIHVTFTAIVPWAYPKEAKICNIKCAKMANIWTHGLIYWETVENKWVHVAMLLTSSESSFRMWHLPRLSQGRTQGRPKCALGWLQKLTHVPLAIAILLVMLGLALTVYTKHYYLMSVCVMYRLLFSWQRVVTTVTEFYCQTIICVNNLMYKTNNQ